MTYKFLELVAAPARQQLEADRANDRFGDDEIDFIGERDSFYMATVSPSGWPYVQHRGGPPGFLRVLDDKTLGFADFRGNRQYITVGNAAASDRAALILVDYPHRARLKILAHVAVHDAAARPDLVEQLSVPGYKAKIERAFVLTLETFDWNCPQHITPRFTAAEIAAAVAPLRDRVAELEAENAALRARLLA